MAEARPWRMFLPLAAVLVLFGAWSVYWWIADTLAQQTMAAQRVQLASRGMSLVCGKERWGGYPFRFEFDCSEPTLSLQGRATVSASHLLAVAQAYNPTHVILLIDGPTRVTAAGAPPIDATHGRALVSLKVKGRHDGELEAEIPQLAVGGLARAATVQLFAKTGTNRQSQLIGLLRSCISLPGQARHGEP